jgi:hypothetical protein
MPCGSLLNLPSTEKTELSKSSKWMYKLLKIAHDKWVREKVIRTTPRSWTIRAMMIKRIWIRGMMIRITRMRSSLVEKENSPRKKF